MSSNLITKHEIVLGKDGLPNGPDCLVGVYGTLKHGYHRHPSLGSHVKHMGRCLIPGILIHNGDWPVLVRQKAGLEFRPGNQIEIEVYKIASTQLRILDQIEGHPSLFERNLLKTTMFGDVYVYLGHTDEWLYGLRNVIWTNSWRGPQSDFIRIDFKDGKVKPHIHVKEAIISATKSNTDALAGVEISIGNGSVKEIVMPLVPENPKSEEEAKSEVIHVANGDSLDTPFPKVASL